MADAQRAGPQRAAPDWQQLVHSRPVMQGGPWQGRLFICPQICDDLDCPTRQVPERMKPLPHLDARNRLAPGLWRHALPAVRVL